jgi:hypothetical protein
MIFSDQCLGKKDIKSLRLTSKGLHPAATREFAIRYLAAPYVVLTQDSLQTLVKICKHPLISPHVRSIGFLTTTLSTYGLKNRVSRLEASTMQTFRIDEFNHRLGSISEYAELCNEQIQLERSGKGKKLLVNALSAFGRPVAIKVTNAPDSINLTEVLGLSEIMYAHDTRSRERVYLLNEANYRTDSLFCLIQEVIAGVSSGTSLNSLEVYFRHQYNDSLVCMTSLYTGMRALRFDIDNSTLRDRDTFFALERLIQAAPNLELLSFTAGRNSKRPIPSSYLDLVSEIFNIPTTCRLQVLRLQDVACSLESLQKLMERHKQTLNSLMFVRVTLLGSWQDCLSWMRKELDLVDFHIEQVCVLERSRMTSKGTFMPRVSKLTTTTLKGKDDTDTGLDRLAQSLS